VLSAQIFNLGQLVPHNRNVYCVNYSEPSLKRCLSIDLEDYFQVDVMAAVVPARYWPRLERRLDETGHAWIDALRPSHSTATFFVSAWAARMHPALVASISAAGHEIAALGLNENPGIATNSTLFADDVTRLKSKLEQITGQSERLPHGRAIKYRSRCRVPL
jgi:peptidoglycan/xylan/chitin deacetylase (PgdA/CDA1 family)